jgi:hypothetical protein
VPWAAYCLEVALSGPYRALQPKRVEQCAEEASGGDGNGGGIRIQDFEGGVRACVPM